VEIQNEAKPIIAETEEEKALKYKQKLEAFKIDYSKVKIE
jgi:hypothetical protein